MPRRTHQLNETKLLAWRRKMGVAESSTMTQEVVEKIVETVKELGAPLTVACQAAGVNKATWEGWCKSYPELRDLVDTARAQWQLETFKRLQRTSRVDPKHWTTLAWSLERTDPDNWAQKGPDGGEAPKLVVQIGKADHVDIKSILAGAGAGEVPSLPSGGSQPAVEVSVGAPGRAASAGSLGPGQSTPPPPSTRTEASTLPDGPTDSVLEGTVVRTGPSQHPEDSGSPSEPD